jgi:hypothetical protein
MAVQNYFTNDATNVGVKQEPGQNAQELIIMIATLEVAAADDDTSTWLLFKGLPNSFRPVRGTLMCDAITAGTDYDIGLYNSDTGVEVDKDIFLDGQTLASASKTLNALGSVDIADIGAKKTLAELLGLTASTAKARYDVVLTGNTVGSAAGTVTVILEGFAA